MAIGAGYFPEMKELGVAKASLGDKLSCQGCGAKFYDLKKKNV